MKKINFTVVLAAVMLSSVTGYSHEDHSKKTRKITDSSIISNSPDTVKINQKDYEQIERERDFERIRKEIKNSSIFIVIKAIGLALAIGGLAFAYLRRRNNGDEA